jgi:protein-S-isoprenylcysteine O-methyltransferase Ste14
MKTLFNALKSLFFMTCFILLWGWVALSVRKFDSDLGTTLPPWTRTAGGVLMLLGATLAVSCVAFFVFRGKGTPAPFDAPREFVAIGPYGYVRNPMYIGGLTLLCGFGLYLGSVSILIFACVLFGAVELFVLYYEEPTLTAKFGAQYEQYCDSVHRWLPKLGAQSSR